MNVNYLNSRDNREVKAIIQQKGLTQIIKKPTRVTQDTKSLIDIIATNNPGSIAEQDVIPTSLSDHDLVGCVRKLNNKMYTSKTVKTRNYAKYNPDNMNRDFEQVNWLPVLSLSNVNDAVNTFNGIVKDIFDKHAPIIQKRVKGRPCAWLNENLKSIINQRDQLLRRARKSNSASDWRKYKDLRNKCNNMQKNAKAKHHKNLIDENRTNPKGFWKAVKTIFPTKANTKNASNNEKDNQTRANAFRDYFSTVVNNLKSSAFKLKNFIWKPPNHICSRTRKSFNFQYVSKVFIKDFLKKKLKRKKSTGLDELPPGMLKDCAQHLIVPLHHIINQSLRSSTVPNAWKQAKIVPLFKSGDTNKPENYRPISVLPILSKLLEKAVHTQLMEFLENEKLLNDSQFGYRAKRSTHLATTLLVDEVRQAAENGKLVGALFLDLSKAFDTISHDVVLRKLSSYGVDNVELLWFTDYLFNRSQVVEVGNRTSASFNVVSGVPQGSILGPILFLIFFNDFSEHLEKSKCIQFADDTVIYVANADPYIIETTLNDELENVSTYLNDNELILNLKKGKTETVLFGTSKRLSRKNTKNTIQLAMQGQPIHHSTSYIYLGNELDSSLTLVDNFEKSYKKAAGRLNLLRKMRPFLSFEAAYKIIL